MNSHRTVAPYDLAAGPSLRPAEMAALRRAAHGFARTLGRVLSEYLSQSVSVEFAGEIKATGPEEDAPPEQQAIWLAPDSDTAAAAPIWRLDWPVASGLLDLMLGRRAEPAESPARAVSLMEGRLLARLCQEFDRVCVAVWPGCAEGEGVTGGDRPRVCPQAAAPSAISLRPADRIALALELAGAGLSGGMEAWLPVAAVKAAQTEAEAGGHNTRQAVPEPSAAMRTTPVTTTVRLATWRTTLRELLDLQPGEVVALDVDADVRPVLSVGGAEKLVVRPGSKNGRVSVQVVEQCSEDGPAAA